jgi:hypothetical protein
MNPAGPAENVPSGRLPIGMQLDKALSEPCWLLRAAVYTLPQRLNPEAIAPFAAVMIDAKSPPSEVILPD